MRRKSVAPSFGFHAKVCLASFWICPGILSQSFFSNPCHLFLIEGMGRSWIFHFHTVLGDPQPSTVGTRVVWYVAYKFLLCPWPFVFQCQIPLCIPLHSLNRWLHKLRWNYHKTLEPCAWICTPLVWRGRSPKYIYIYINEKEIWDNQENRILGYFIYVRPFDRSSGLLRLKYSVFRERPICMWFLNVAS